MDVFRSWILRIGKNIRKKREKMYANDHRKTHENEVSKNSKMKQRQSIGRHISEPSEPQGGVECCGKDNIHGVSL